VRKDRAVVGAAGKSSTIHRSLSTGILSYEIQEATAFEGVSSVLNLVAGRDRHFGQTEGAKDRMHVHLVFDP
jgi:hypothetical protein